VHRPPTKLDKLASHQPNCRPDAPSPPPDSVPAFSPTARRLPLHRAEVTDVFYTPAVPRPNSPAIIVKSNTPDSSRLSRRGTQLLSPHWSSGIREWFSRFPLCPARISCCSARPAHDLKLQARDDFYNFGDFGFCTPGRPLLCHTDLGALGGDTDRTLYANDAVFCLELSQRVD